MTAIAFVIRTYTPEDRPAIRRILERIGWAEQYIAAFERTAKAFSADPEGHGVYVAMVEGLVAGFLFVEVHTWNGLAQIQGLAVDPDHQRHGLASALVERAEGFARQRQARGIYVDTPTSNTRGRRFYERAGYTAAYVMPRYYEDGLDGVTYQKFWSERPSGGLEMGIDYKVDFDRMAWESPMAGVRHKYLDQAGQRVRLVEYSRDMPAHWCEKGHAGYLISGEMEIEYAATTVTYRAGDGIFIPDGPEHKHRGRVLSEKALVFFIEKV